MIERIWVVSPFGDVWRQSKSWVRGSITTLIVALPTWKKDKGVLVPIRKGSDAGDFALIVDEERFVQSYVIPWRNESI